MQHSVPMPPILTNGLIDPALAQSMWDSPEMGEAMAAFEARDPVRLRSAVARLPSAQARVLAWIGAITHSIKTLDARDRIRVLMDTWFTSPFDSSASRLVALAAAELTGRRCG